LDEIAEICGCSKAKVQQAIKQAELLLPSENLVKKVEFLAKSYNRVQLTFKKENVITLQAEEGGQPTVEKSKMGKKPLLIWVVGILLLVAIVTVPVVTSEEYGASKAEKYVETLSASFESEIQKKYTKLGLVELDEKESDEIMYMDTFGENARSRFSLLESNLKFKLTNGHRIDKDKTEQEYNEILQELELPSEMAAELIENPLIESEEESEEFIKRYIETYFAIQNQYYYVVSQHEEEVGKAVEAADFDSEKFLANKGTYSKELQNLINATEAQNIELYIIPENRYVLPVFMENGTAKKISESLYGNVGGYMALVQSGNFYIVDADNPDLNKVYSDLLAVEETLLNVKRTDDLYMQLKSVFVSMFQVLTFGYEPNKRFDVNGKLKDEYREIMMKVAKNENTNSPSAFAMKNVIEFMKTNDWKETEDSYYLTYPLFDLIDQARKGETESFAWPTVEMYKEMESGESIDEDQLVGYQEGVSETTNPDYIAAVQRTYKLLTTANNRRVLTDVEPIVILGVYLYANEQEDPGTMWLLRNRETMEMTKKEYVDTWEKQALELHGAEKIFAEKGANESNGVPLVPIQYELSGETIYDGWLKWNEDSQTWEIEIAPERTVVDG
jgi:phage anti-repressor protein